MAGPWGQTGVCCSSLRDKTVPLTGHVEELREGLHRHELLLEGLQGSVGSLADGHVVVADVLRQRAGPASLRVAGGHLLQEPADGPGWRVAPPAGRVSPAEPRKAPPSLISRGPPGECVLSQEQRTSTSPLSARPLHTCRSNLQSTASGSILASLHMSHLRSPKRRES